MIVAATILIILAVTEDRQDRQVREGVPVREVQEEPRGQWARKALKDFRVQPVQWGRRALPD